VLIEPIDQEQKNNPVATFNKIIEANKPLALATIFQSSCAEVLSGQKLLLDEDGRVIEDTLNNNFIKENIINDLQQLFTLKRSDTRSYSIDGNLVDAYLELIQPSISLIIFGGGFDARPVSALAKSLGWEVQVTDECVAHIAPVFFPSADKLSLCDRTFIDRDFNITEYTACVHMSHNYAYDRDVLKQILTSASPYIGILGPRKRFDKMLEEYEKEGIMLSHSDTQRIHSPIGIDLGAETPDEIALSIIGEVQAKFSNRSGGFLKYRQGPIHQSDLTSDQVFKQIFINDRHSKSADNH
jgi:xanthine/CO dehydrogenase XdhC/CoxF family maturation factor